MCIRDRYDVSFCSALETGTTPPYTCETRLFLPSSCISLRIVISDTCKNCESCLIVKNCEFFINFASCICRSFNSFITCRLLSRKYGFRLVSAKRPLYQFIGYAVYLFRIKIRKMAVAVKPESAAFHNDGKTRFSCGCEFFLYVGDIDSQMLNAVAVFFDKVGVNRCLLYTSDAADEL